MAIGTDKWDEHLKEWNCQRLHLDAYEMEPYYVSSETVKVKGKTYYPYLLRFTLNGKKLVAVIPVSIKKKVIKTWPFTFNTYSYDIEAMGKEAERIVEKLKQEITQ